MLDDLDSQALRDLVASAGDWLWETDADHRYTAISDSLLEFAGLDPTRFIGRSRTDNLAAVALSSGACARHLADIESHKAFRDFVCRAINAAGEQRWISISGHPKFDAVGAFAGYRGVGRNITALMSDAAGVQFSQSSKSPASADDLQRTVDAMPMGVVVLDPDLRAVVVNRAFYDLWKITPDDVGVGQHFRALMDINRQNGIYEVADHKWESYVATRLAEISQGNIAPRELSRADGRTLIYSVTNLSGGKRLVTYFDISGQKQREAELAQALERSKLAEAVINGVSDPIFVKDANLDYVLVNEAFADLFGCSRETMIGKQASDFLAAEEAQRYEMSESMVLQSAQTYETEEAFQQDGEWKSRIVRKNRVNTDSGRSYVAGFVFDVTEMKRRETEAHEARQRLADVIESLPAGVIIYDRDDKFVLANDIIKQAVPALAESMVPGASLRKAIEMAHAAGYFRKSGDAELDALYDTNREAWIKGYVRRYALVRNVSERRNPDGRWHQVFDTRTPDGAFVGVRVDITELKERETALLESMSRIELYQRVLDEMSVGAFVKTDERRLDYVNKAWSEMTGVSREQALGKTDEELFDGANATQFARDDRRVLDTGEPLAIEESIDRGGGVTDLMTRKQRLVREDGARFLFGSCADVTEIKQREKVLRESMRENELYRQVLNEIPVNIFVKTPSGRFEYINKAFTEMTGFTVDEVIGKTDMEVFDLGEASGFESDDERIQRTGEAVEVEETLTHRDGRRYYIMTRKTSLRGIDGTLHLFGCCTDITGVKERESVLRDSMRENEIFRCLIDNVPVAIYAKREDLRLAYVNKGWSELTGFSKDEAVGRTDGEIFGTDGELFMEGDLQVLRNGETLEINETVSQPDGSVRYQLARKGTMAASDGSLYLIGSTSDVTELKNRERELEDAQRRAVLADRAKSEFLANMSHEIRTPMNGVLGMAELLAKTTLDPKQRTFTDIIVKSGNALLTIINDILDFSKIDAGQLVLDPAPFSLAEAIEDVATLVSTRAKEKDLELIVRVEPGLPGRFVGDVGRIRQIITNLLGNAVKFTDSGHVLVNVTGNRGGERTELTIAVTDTGIGIPADKLQSVFEKFSQVDASSTRRHEGTGLGLAITSRLINLMDGTISVQSDEGQGSTFTVKLALDHADDQKAKRPVPLDVSGARVLVVDDNSINRAILMEQMTSWSFDACAARDGAEAISVLQAMEKLGLKIDCAVLDYQMPGMTGAELAAHIRSSAYFGSTPIVLLTSVDESLSKYRELNIDSHLIKPARSSALLDAIVTSVQKRRLIAGHAEPVVDSFETAIAAMRKVAATAALPENVAQRADGQLDILVAEDNEVNQLVFTQILSETGYRFEIVGNGKLALEAATRLNPRMILMDVSMPFMNGLEATEAIRERERVSGAHIPIVGVTAHALKGDRERCIEAGMDDYLPKPISPNALLEKIRRWIETDQAMAQAG